MISTKFLPDNGNGVHNIVVASLLLQWMYNSSHLCIIPQTKKWRYMLICINGREVKNRIYLKKVFALLDKTQLSGDSKEQGKVCYFRVGERQDE